MQVTRSSDGGGPWPEPGKPQDDGQQLYLEDLHAGQGSAQHRHRSKSDLPPSPSRARTRAPDQSPDQSLALRLSAPNSTKSCAYVSRSRCPVATRCCASWPMSYVVAAMSATASCAHDHQGKSPVRPPLETEPPQLPRQHVRTRLTCQCRHHADLEARSPGFHADGPYLPLATPKQNCAA